MIQQLQLQLRRNYVGSKLKFGQAFDLYRRNVPKQMPCEHNAGIFIKSNPLSCFTSLTQTHKMPVDRFIIDSMPEAFKRDLKEAIDILLSNMPTKTQTTQKDTKLLLSQRAGPQFPQNDQEYKRNYGQREKYVQKNMLQHDNKGPTDSQLEMQNVVLEKSIVDQQLEKFNQSLTIDGSKSYVQDVLDMQDNYASSHMSGRQKLKQMQLYDSNLVRTDELSHINKKILEFPAYLKKTFESINPRHPRRDEIYLRQLIKTYQEENGNVISIFTQMAEEDSKNRQLLTAENNQFSDIQPMIVNDSY